MTKNTAKNKLGFTLIELLVVISIIALLMGILVPVLRKARNAATSTACQANLRSMGYAFMMYLDDNRQIMPPASIMPAEGVTTPSIMDFLMTYLSEPETFECPADTQDDYYENSGTSYGYNAKLGGTTVDRSFFAQVARCKAINIHVMRDLQPFHGRANYLYADGHVSDSREQH